MNISLGKLLIFNDILTNNNHVRLVEFSSLTGNRDYTDSTMPYRIVPISIEDGAWIGAKTTVCPGVTVHCNSILTVGSVVTKDMEANGIYQGIPANRIGKRIIKE